MELEFTFREPLDPDVLALFYGGEPVPPQYALTITTPIKRKWWKRLLRRPQQYSIIHIPHAVMTLSDDAA